MMKGKGGGREREGLSWHCMHHKFVGCGLLTIRNFEFSSNCLVITQNSQQVVGTPGTSEKEWCKIENLVRVCTQ